MARDSGYRENPLVDQDKCLHLVGHKSIEEGCPEHMYCVLCGKTWTMEEFEKEYKNTLGGENEVS